ncbi:MAG: pentapeptide repeat-containing protein, partial [Chloroflexi bacterium]|nr:pentapeptide repeat-containing protein [Chloroflexota bacterium]
LDFAQLQGARLDSAQLQGAQLDGAQLQGASLFYAQLQGAILWRAQLQGARLDSAQLQGAFLYGTELKEALLEDVDWSAGYVLGNERMANDFGSYQKAEAAYRSLKLWYTNNGQYDIAGEFHFREMIMRRKRFWLTEASARKQRAQHKAESAVLLLFQVVAGFGEMPSRALLGALACVLGFSLAYFNYSAIDVTTWKAWGTFSDRLWKALYFSTVSFTNLGYGSWVETDGIAPEGWTHNLGALESIFGLFLITLFLVTFVRKVSRS